MINGFRCKRTQQLFQGSCPKEFRQFEAQAQRKLEMLNAAMAVGDLRSPPGNQLVKLSGDRDGQYSIRINLVKAVGQEFTG
jgi:proteic killer suppression protein